MQDSAATFLCTPAIDANHTLPNDPCPRGQLLNAPDRLRISRDSIGSHTMIKLAQIAGSLVRSTRDVVLGDAQFKISTILVENTVAAWNTKSGRPLCTDSVDKLSQIVDFPWFREHPAPMI
jgi:hypothetical protein